MSPDADEPGRRTPPAPGWFNRTVLGAGLTSACGDFAYETTQVILPGFLAALGIPAAGLGLIEGLADATASFTKLGAGYLSDRLGMRKPLVVCGYALTPIGQTLIALALGWPLILCGRLLSWFGKGIRGPLRDAIVAESIPAESRGRAFGFHRAMDTLGAVFGPLSGVALLSWAQQSGPTDSAAAFRFVIWCTLVPGVLSVLSFALLVRDPGGRAQPGLPFWRSLRGLPAGFRQYLGAVGLFGCGDFSHTLLVLAATELLTPSLGLVRAAQVAGALYVLRNVVQALSSFPVGAAADRWGHRRILAGGYVLGAATALLAAGAFRSPAGEGIVLTALFAIAGLYTAVQEALEPTLTAEFAPAEVRGVAFGALGAVNGVGKLASSAVVGTLWTTVAPEAAFGVAAAIMAAGAVLLARVRRST